MIDLVINLQDLKEVLSAIFDHPEEPVLGME